MTRALVVTAVAPIGEKPVTALACPGGHVVTYMEPAYPPAPLGDALRRLCDACDVGLREAARVLELHPSRLCDLKFGRATMSAEDWCEAFARIAAAACTCGAKPGAAHALACRKILGAREPA